MAKRSLNGSHVKVLLLRRRTELPDNFFALLKLAFEMGKEGTKPVLKQRDSLNENVFIEQYATFAMHAKEDQGCLHLLRSTFLAGLALQMNRRNITRRIQIRNKFLVSTMAQRELTLGLWHLNEEDTKRASRWYKEINADQSWWKRHFFGALTVARLARLFLRAGAEVRLSTPEEDVDWKIDMIASFPGRSEGLCIQVKSNESTEWIVHDTFDSTNREELPDNTIRLLNGVKAFQKTYRGIWKPIEIELGRKHFQGGLLPVGHLEEALFHMLDNVLEAGFERPEEELTDAP